jgi:hypothetical protein
MGSFLAAWLAHRPSVQPSKNVKGILLPGKSMLPIIFFKAFGYALGLRIEIMANGAWRRSNSLNRLVPALLTSDSAD